MSGRAMPARSSTRCPSRGEWWSGQIQQGRRTGPAARSGLDSSGGPVGRLVDVDAKEWDQDDVGDDQDANVNSPPDPGVVFFVAHAALLALCSANPAEA